MTSILFMDIIGRRLGYNSVSSASQNPISPSAEPIVSPVDSQDAVPRYWSEVNASVDPGRSDVHFHW